MKFKILALAVGMSSLMATSVFAKGGSVEGITVPLALYVSQSTLSEAFDTKDDESDVSMTSYDLNIGLGYTFSTGIFIGGKYVMGSMTSKADVKATSGTGTVSAESEEVSSESGYGVSLGYFSKMGLNLTATYLISWGSETSDSTTSAGTVSSDSKEVNEDGSGFMVDLSYAYMLNKTFGFGPHFSYRSTSAAKRTTTDNLTSTEVEEKGTFKESKFVPTVAMWLVL